MNRRTLLRAATIASYDGYECELVRTLTLDGRTLTSETRMRNWGARVVPLR